MSVIEATWIPNTSSLFSSLSSLSFLSLYLYSFLTPFPPKCLQLCELTTHHGCCFFLCFIPFQMLPASWYCTDVITHTCTHSQSSSKALQINGLAGFPLLDLTYGVAHSWVANILQEKQPVVHHAQSPPQGSEGKGSWQTAPFRADVIMNLTSNTIPQGHSFTL